MSKKHKKCTGHVVGFVGARDADRGEEIILYKSGPKNSFDHIKAWPRSSVIRFAFCPKCGKRVHDESDM